MESSDSMRCLRGKTTCIPRRICFRLLVVVAVGGCLNGICAAQPFSDTALVIGNGTAGPYFLTGRPLLSRMLRISEYRGKPLPDLLYTLYDNPGRVVFSRAISNRDTMLVQFSALPFAVRSTYEPARHAQAMSVPVAAVSATNSYAGPVTQVQAPFRLEVSGAKTFGITVGNQNEALTRQGLQLSVDGQLTETIKLTATISDRFSDRLSSGAAASRLNNLDDFFMAVKSPRFGARLGDLLVSPSSPGAHAPRRLSGGEISFLTGKHRLYTAAGKVAGLPRRIEFFGTAGRQGPYALTAGHRAIVANSETVYLDGRRLERGSDRDYVIDHFTGEITFTPRIILSENTRVTVDFEESAHTYLRRAAFGSWQSKGFAGRLVNHFGLEWEADDPNAGMGFSLSPQDRDTLQQTTNGHIKRDGAEYVGAGRGEYNAIHADEGVFYEYAGPENGDYNVRFEYVGAGQGSYVHLGGGAFGYLGETRGDFVPRITVNAPYERMFLTDRIQLSRTPIGGVSLALVAQAVQPNRLNRASRRADWAHDLQWTSSARTDGEPASKKIHATTRWRRLGRQTETDLGVPVSDITREWYLPPGQYPANTDIIESKVEFGFSPRLKVTTEYGRLMGSSLGRRNAESIEASIIPALTTRFSHRRSEAQLESPDSIRSREVWSAGQAWQHRWAEFSAGLHREDRQVAADSGDRLEGYELGVCIRELRLTIADDRVYDVAGSPTLAEKRRRVTLDGSWAISTLGMTGSVSATRAGRRHVSNDRFYRDYLGRADMHWSWPGWGLSATLHYDLNRIGARYRTESFIPVAEGFGDYRREDSLFTPDQAGDFMRVTGSMGELRSTAAGQKEFILRRSYGDHRTTWLHFLQDYSGELYLTRQEQIDPEQLSVFGWMVPWGDLKAGGTAVGPSLLRYETRAGVERRFPAGSGFWFVRGRYRERYNRYGTPSSPVESYRLIWEASARGNVRGRAWKSWEVSLARHEHRTARYTGIAPIDVRSHRGQVIGSFKLSAKTQTSIKLSMEYLWDRTVRAPARIYGISPAITFRPGPRAGWGSLKSGVEYYFAESDLRGAFIPGVVGLGRYYPGHNARVFLTGRLEISGSISVDLRSSLEAFARRRPLYRMNLQATSKF